MNTNHTVNITRKTQDALSSIFPCEYLSYCIDPLNDAPLYSRTKETTWTDGSNQTLAGVKSKRRNAGEFKVTYIIRNSNDVIVFISFVIDASLRIATQKVLAAF